MPWVPIINPSKELLDSLYAERLKNADQPCPDCGVKPGEKHRKNCDVARCLTCGGQRLSCDCKTDEGDGDIWDGLWPGTKECYEKGYVCKWVGPKPIKGAYSEGEPIFDFNRL